MRFDDREAVPTEINGVTVTRPHFFEFPGCTRGHHAIETIDGHPNLLIGTNGAHKTVYAVEGGEARYLDEGRVTTIEASREFIWIGNTLYHIPTQVGSSLGLRPREVTYVGRNMFTVETAKDTYIEWTGVDFKLIEKTQPEDVQMKTEQYGEETLERPMNDLREVADYDMLLDKLVRQMPYVHTKGQARAFLEGDHDIPIPDDDLREVMRRDFEQDEIEHIRALRA